MSPQPFAFRRVVRGSVVLIGALFVLVYIIFQARFLIIGPQIILTAELPMRQNERQITLTGQTNNISHLQLNGRNIFTDPQGAFSTTVTLQNGYTQVTLQAADRYGRTTTVTREFVYVPMNFMTTTPTLNGQPIPHS